MSANSSFIHSNKLCRPRSNCSQLFWPTYFLLNFLTSLSSLSFISVQTAFLFSISFHGSKVILICVDWNSRNRSANLLYHRHPVCFMIESADLNSSYWAIPFLLKWRTAGHSKLTVLSLCQPVPDPLHLNDWYLTFSYLQFQGYFQETLHFEEADLYVRSCQWSDWWMHCRVCTHFASNLEPPNSDESTLSRSNLN